ncbi:MAG: hypothetical protein CML67_18900 [Rhodobacteraceae bacterium]|nr:hypothetical protein [Paracoccaceae bacterium]
MGNNNDRKIISAFTEEQVTRLTGISSHRLRYWDRTGFFHPAFAAENRRAAYSRVYSFMDVTALRVISVLINQHSIPLQHLRKVIFELGTMDNSAWARTTLYVLNRKVIFHDPEDGRQREVVSGQYMIGIPLKTIVSDTRRDVKALSIRSDADLGKIEKHRRISHNSAVIAGTRIPVRSIQQFSEAGYSVEQILQEYPTLTKKDIMAAIEFNRAA